MVVVDKKIVLWTGLLLIAATALNWLASGGGTSEYCSYLPVRCVMGIVASGVGGLFGLSPIVAAIAGIWFLFSKKRHRLPLVIAWSFLLLTILILFVSGQASIST